MAMRVRAFLLSKAFSKAFFQGQISKLSNNLPLPPRYIHLSAIRKDLMEFFDDKKYWGETHIKVGRSWKVDELRLKSNVEIHKLWYILLKEKNMLLTMEHEANEQLETFANPERIDKVEESMRNIEAVVRERNRAYYLLETGQTGERSGEVSENFLGLQEYKEFEEHHVPKEENKEFLKAEQAEPKTSWKEKKYFLTRLRVKQRKEEQSQISEQQRDVIRLLMKYPDCDKEALKEKYPLVDVDRYINNINDQMHVDNFDERSRRKHLITKIKS